MQEWMLSYANRSEAKDVLRQHYQTWITEKDFQEMKAMGLNAVRLVIPYWTLEDGPPAYAANLTNATITTATNDTVVPEPFFFKGQRKYVRSALQWAKKYDLQVVLDLHTAPGSQNGFDNSGKAGSIDWDNNPDYYNRTLKCLETMVDWYVNNDDPLYSGIVKAIGVLNEPRVGQSNRTIPIKFLKKFYVESYATIRNRVSAAKGAKTMPTLLFSDGLIGADDWLGWYAAMFKNGTFKRGSVIMDQHLYQAFQPLKKLNRTEHINYTCGISKTLARTQSIVPVIIGEMANALGGVCGYYPTCWNHTMEDDINWYNTAGGNLYFRKLWEAQQLAYEGSAGGWFMWSWKTFAASQWSYRDSVAQGWIPRNLDERVVEDPAAASSSSDQLHQHCIELEHAQYFHFTGYLDDQHLHFTGYLDDQHLHLTGHLNDQHFQLIEHLDAQQLLFQLIQYPNAEQRLLHQCQHHDVDVYYSDACDYQLEHL
ncbi:unnamed protein product [Tilletia controversa]|nr:unnamed protein product [Tilletia controversa]CAD6914685.1 unnamed protein product [Tilletia controversa]